MTKIIIHMINSARINLVDRQESEGVVVTEIEAPKRETRDHELGHMRGGGLTLTGREETVIEGEIDQMTVRDEITTIEKGEEVTKEAAENAIMKKEGEIAVKSIVKDEDREIECPLGRFTIAQACSKTSSPSLSLP